MFGISLDETNTSSEKQFINNVWNCTRNGFGARTGVAVRFDVALLHTGAPGGDLDLRLCMFERRKSGNAIWV